MLTISRDKVVDRLEGGAVPAAYCESGGRVVFETRDCYDDDPITEGAPEGDGKDRLENPATGPLYVNGAMPGDVLKVRIEEIRLRGYGIMRTSPTAGAFHHLYDKRTARRFYLEKKKDTGKTGFWFDSQTWLDCDPMIGVIGTAPEGEPVPTVTPGVHGGNMDCNKIITGSTLYLPVNVPGALLALGDLHARMGDGEVMICGLETAGAVTVQVTVLKAEEERSGCLKGALPLLVGSGEEAVMTIQSAPTLDEAALLAARRMQRLVAGLTGLDDVASGMLMSLLSDLAVCQIVNPLLTVRCAFPMEILKSYGVLLP